MIIVKPSFDILNCPEGGELLEMIERAGRTCYKSEDKIGCQHPDGYEYSDTCQRLPLHGCGGCAHHSSTKLVKALLKRGHHSVIEHASITVRFVCDRGVSHELVRHRLAAYSQESTRYCDYTGGHITFVLPPWFPAGLEGVYGDAEDKSDLWRRAGTAQELEADELGYLRALVFAEEQYQNLRALGWRPEQARSVLPNSLKTEIVMTANVREWRHVFNLRCAKAAHPQMRELMVPLLLELRDRVPVIFDDVHPGIKEG
jgi:thymidylate synthase (FAD)